MRDKAFGKRVRRLRIDRGLTQEEAAKRLGIKYKTYQTHEAGQWPRRKTQERYIQFHQCNRNWFLTGDGEPYIKKDREGDQGGGIRAADKQGPWARTEEKLIGDVKTTVQIYGPSKVASSRLPREPDAFGDAVDRLRDIFDTGDAAVKQAILANINVFSFTARLLREYEALKTECDDAIIRLKRIEELIAKYHPPEEVGERREVLVEMKKALGI